MLISLRDQKTRLPFWPSCKILIKLDSKLECVPLSSWFFAANPWFIFASSQHKLPSSLRPHRARWSCRSAWRWWVHASSGKSVLFNADPFGWFQVALWTIHPWFNIENNIHNLQSLHESRDPQPVKCSNSIRSKCHQLGNHELLQRVVQHWRHLKTRALQFFRGLLWEKFHLIF